MRLKLMFTPWDVHEFEAYCNKKMTFQSFCGGAYETQTHDLFNAIEAL